MDRMDMVADGSDNADLAAHVQQRLRDSSSWQLRDVDVRACENGLLLSGVVTSRYYKLLAQVMAIQIEGVGRIENSIRVRQSH